MELFKPEFGLAFWMFIAFLCLFGILALEGLSLGEDEVELRLAHDGKVGSTVLEPGGFVDSLRERGQLCATRNTNDVATNRHVVEGLTGILTLQHQVVDSLA